MPASPTQAGLGRAQRDRGQPGPRMWFHGPFRADQWLLYVQESPVATGVRGLALGQILPGRPAYRLGRPGGAHPGLPLRGISADLAHPPAGLDTCGCLRLHEPVAA
jgi:hypothetical protein